MYTIMTNLSKEVLLERKTEKEAYDAALKLAGQHLGVTFWIFKGKPAYGDQIAEFCVEKLADPLYYAEQGMKLLNGGPILEGLQKSILDALPDNPSEREIQ